MSFGQVLALSLVVAFSVGCVRRAEYDAVTADLNAAREEAHAMSLEAERLRVEGRRLEGNDQKSRAEKQELETKDAELAKNLEDLALMNTELMNRLKGAGQSVEQLAQERGSLEQALTTTRAQLAEWRKQQTALAARSAQERQLAVGLRVPLEQQGLTLGARGGYLVLTLPSDLLFEPGSVSVKAAGRPTLLQTAQALRGLSGRRFRIAAHVDAARPAPGGATPSSPNWQLTASRALAVTRELILAGVSPAALSATASAEYDPVVADDTPAGHARNRRIEIVFEPLPDEMGKPKP
jgi:chemotaxis protein MotB